MLQDKEVLPEPTHIAEIMKKLEENELVALIEADIFSVKAQQEDKAVRVNITLPKSLLELLMRKLYNCILTARY